MLKKKISLFIIASLLLYVSGCSKGPSVLEEPPGPPKPIADFTYTINPQTPTRVTFVNTSQHAETYEWSYGTGFSTLKNPPEVDFGGYKKQLVILTVTGPGGESTVSKMVETTSPYKKMVIKEVVLTMLSVTTKFDVDSDPDLYISVTGGNNTTYSTSGISQYNNWPPAEDAYWAMQYGYIVDDLTKNCSIRFYDADNAAGGDPDDLIATYTFVPSTYTMPGGNMFPTTIQISQGGLLGYISVVWV